MVRSISKIKNKYRNHDKSLVCILLCIYSVMSIFEGHLNNIIGNNTKYLILAICFFLIYKATSSRFVSFKNFQVWYLLWFFYRFLSLGWSQDYATPKLHFVSQVAMLVFMISITMYPISTNVIRKFTNAYFYSSGLMGVLSLLFGKAYLGDNENRQVLSVLGAEIDPNNLAALLLVGISIGMYYLFILKQKKIVSLVIIGLNVMACMFTGSRSGLVAMFMVFLFAIILSQNKIKLKSTFTKIILVTLVIVFIYYFIINYLPSGTYERLFDFDSYEGGGNRTYMWKNVFSAYTKNIFSIIFGMGWGSSTANTGSRLAVHNTFLTMLCDVGIIGTFMFFYPFVKSLLYLIKRKEYLPLLLVVAQFIPAFFLDAINKRFFWNAIIFVFVCYVAVKNEYCRKGVEYHGNSILFSEN